MVGSGASRKFEPSREEDGVVDKENRKQEAEEMGNAMRALENRANNSKQDMDILAALEEMRSMKPRHAGVSVDKMLKILEHSAHLKEEKTEAELDEELIKSITFRNSKDYVKQIEDDNGDEDFVIPGQSSVMAKLAESSVIFVLETNGSSESVLYSIDFLTKTNGPESSNKEGNKTVTEDSGSWSHNCVGGDEPL